MTARAVLGELAVDRPYKCCRRVVNAQAQIEIERAVMKSRRRCIGAIGATACSVGRHARCRQLAEMAGAAGTQYRVLACRREVGVVGDNYANKRKEAEESSLNHIETGHGDGS